MNANKVILALISIVLFGGEVTACEVTKFPLKTESKVSEDSFFDYFSKTKRANLFQYYYFEVVHNKNSPLQKSLYKYLTAGKVAKDEQIQLEILEKRGNKILSEKELCEVVKEFSSHR